MSTSSTVNGSGPTIALALTVWFAKVEIVGAPLTGVLAVPLSLPGVGSVVVAVFVAVLAMFVPPVVVGPTLTTIWKTAVSGLATVAFEKMTVPVPPTDGALAVQPLPVVTDAATKVVLAGTASVTRDRRGSARPVVHDRDRVGAGCCRSHGVGRVDCSDRQIRNAPRSSSPSRSRCRRWIASRRTEASPCSWSTVPAAVDGATATTSVKKSTVRQTRKLVHETEPVPPTARVVHDQLPVVESETNVVFAGTCRIARRRRRRWVRC